MDPADAAELARRMRAAVVEEMPRRRWMLPVGLLVLTIVALAVIFLVS